MTGAIIVTVVITLLIVSTVILAYLLIQSKKKLAVVDKTPSTEADTNTDSGIKETFLEQQVKDLYGDQSDLLIERKENLEKQGFMVLNGRPYMLGQCEEGSVYHLNNRWINNNATHSLKRVKEIKDKVSVQLAVVCTMGYSTSNGGTKFVLEDSFGKMTTEPCKIPLSVLQEIRDRLVLVQGYVENGKIYPQKILRTKIQVAVS